MDISQEANLVEPSIEGAASHSILFDDFYLEFLDLVNFVNFVGYGSCSNNEIFSVCKEIEELLKINDIALSIATTDNGSIFLTPFGDSSNGQSQEPLEYEELDAHLREVYEEHMLVHPRKCAFQALDMINVQWDPGGGSRHNLWWESVHEHGSMREVILVATFPP